MKIISGSLKGKKLYSIPGISTRPTAARVRESIFNICSPIIQNTVVLDLFAGTGAFGIEAMSRGADTAVFIDVSIQAINTIKKNISACKLQSKTRLIKWNILKNLNCLETIQKKINLVFMDPPYNTKAIIPTLNNLQQSGVLNKSATIIIEHAVSESELEIPRPFELSDQRKYRKTLVSFLRYMIDK